MDPVMHVSVASCVDLLVCAAFWSVKGARSKYIHDLLVWPDLEKRSQPDHKPVGDRKPHLLGVARRCLTDGAD